MKKKEIIRVFTAFSGYESQMMALMILQSKYPYIEFRLVGWCEIDKAAIRSHDAVFPEYTDCHYNDITCIDWTKVPDFDMLFYSSCCQSVSQTGALEGMEVGSGTQSALIWYVLDAIRTKKPKYCILENVGNMASKTFIVSFDKWQRSVNALGYKNYSMILNAADYNVPQGRERLFMVSIREDIDRHFDFPKPVKQTRKAVDLLLDQDVSEKYYLSQEETAKYLMAVCGKPVDGSVAKSLPVPSGGKLKSQMMSQTLVARGKEIPTDLRPIPTITATGYEGCTYKNLYGSGNFPKTGVVEFWEGGKDIPDYHRLTDNATGELKKVRNASANDIMNKVRSLAPGEYVRLRRMTPKELFCFMGVPERYLSRLCDSGNPDAELYKQAGNSIVVDVLIHLFESLFINNG